MKAQETARRIWRSNKHATRGFDSDQQGRGKSCESKQCSRRWLHRTSRNLLRTLQEAREAIDDRELINLRDRAGEVERASELVVSEARDGLDFTSAQQAEAQAKVSLQLAREGHKLNTIAAVFLPITALASIFSMTLRSGLERWFSPWLFWFIVAAGVALGMTMKAQLGLSPHPDPLPVQGEGGARSGAVPAAALRAAP